MNLARVPTLLRLVAALALATPMTACGVFGPPPVSPAAKRLAYAVTSASDTKAPADVQASAVGALQEALAAEGLTVYPRPGGAVDVSVVLFLEQTPSAIQITKNGHVVPHWRVLAVLFDRQSQIMDRFNDDFTADVVDATDVAGIARSIAASPSLAVLADRNAAAAQSALREDEEAAWTALSTTRCEHAKGPDDCAPIEKFLQQFPSGVHADEARAVLARRPR